MQELVDRAKILIFDNDGLFDKKAEIMQLIKDIESLGGILIEDHKCNGDEIYQLSVRSEDIYVQATFMNVELELNYLRVIFMFDNLVVKYTLYLSDYIDGRANDGYMIYTINDDIKNDIFSQWTIKNYNCIFGVICHWRLLGKHKKDFKFPQIKSARN